MLGTNNGRAGDHVFTNVDMALANKIIARSKENSASAGADASASAPMPDVNDSVDNGIGKDGVWLRREPVSFVKLAIPAVLAVVVLALLIFRRKGK
jgi:hypothetical protein